MLFLMTPLHKSYLLWHIFGPGFRERRLIHILSNSRTGWHWHWLFGNIKIHHTFHMPKFVKMTFSCVSSPVRQTLELRIFAPCLAVLVSTGSCTPFKAFIKSSFALLCWGNTPFNALQCWGNTPFKIYQARSQSQFLWSTWPKGLSLPHMAYNFR